MHKDFMRAALNQAWLGRGSCAPNPSVGAVVVHENRIIASAFHSGAGHAHAEQKVLEQLPTGLSSLTLYVTLEPCNHWGRTPPCVDAITNYPIERVVYAFNDPNPVVAKNNTPEILKDRGIEVIHYPLPEINQFYQSYQHWLRTKKPWVTAKIAQSLDGKIAGVGGLPIQLSNAGCAEFTHEQRFHTDVILTTARTVVADNPRLNARVGSDSKPKILAILDKHLELTGRELVFSEAEDVHLFYDAALTIKNPIKNCRYHAIALRSQQLDLEAVVLLLGQLGFHDVWVEAGGRLFSALHESKLVNTSYVYIVPKLLGKNAVSAYHSEHLFEGSHRVSWHAKQENMIMQVDWEEACLQG